MAGACLSVCCDRLCYATSQRWCWVGFLRGVLCQKDEKASNFIWGPGVCWGVGVGGGLVGVGLGLLRFAGGINVASK